MREQYDAEREKKNKKIICTVIVVVLYICIFLQILMQVFFGLKYAKLNTFYILKYAKLNTFGLKLITYQSTPLPSYQKIKFKK